MTAGGLRWGAIARIGLVQAAIGMVVVLTTSLVNRLMVVELGFAASVPGALVGLHYALQLLRPKWGHDADRGGARTPWIVGGMAVLGAGGALACVAVAWMGSARGPGLALAVLAFLLVGTGVGCAGTTLLTLLAERTEPQRRPAAAAIVWTMMIAGFVVSTVLAARALTPFTPARLVAVGTGMSVLAFAIAALAIRGVEASAAAQARPPAPPFRLSLAEVWADPEARRFTAFVAVSMLAYSAQDLILEPFAGLVFALPPAATTALTSVQNGGVLAGMVAVALAGRRLGFGSLPALRRLTVVGCLASALSLALIGWAGTAGVLPAFRGAVAALGFSNGVFAVSAVGLMMALAGGGATPGTRMGVWGAAQALAFGGGGFLGTVAVDAVRLAIGRAAPAYVAVFAAEAVLFVAAALVMRRGEAARAMAPA